MLKDQIARFISDELKKNHEASSIEMYQEEMEFAEKHYLIPENIKITEKVSMSRFANAYMERIDKTTEEVLAKETADFLHQPIDYFNKHKNEFLYVESKWFEIIRVEAISFEVDDVFGTYDVMLGLRLPKKMANTIKSTLKEKLKNENSTFDLLFSNEDGLWDLNFSLNDVPGFREDLQVWEAFCLIYTFLFKLVEAVAVSDK